MNEAMDVKIRWFVEKAKPSDSGLPCSLCGTKIDKYATLVYDTQKKQEARFHNKCYAIWHKEHVVKHKPQ